MIPSQIEKEIRIEAPVEVVWRLVTEPAHITQWFSDDAQLDLRSGGAGHLGKYEITIEDVDPLRLFAFRWVYPAGSKPDSRNSTLVEFTLTSEAGGTRLRVVESGFDQIDWSDAEKAKQVENHKRGWRECFERLGSLALRHAGSEVRHESIGGS